MTLSRWDPFDDLVSLRRAMDRLTGEPFGPRAPRCELNDALAVDMYQTPDRVIVEAALPGVKPEDVEITVSGDTLTIKGEIKQEEKIEREDCFFQERRYGSFSRTVLLPAGVKVDAAEATLENGVLTLTLPKAEETRQKTIKVTSKATEAKKISAKAA